MILARILARTSLVCLTVLLLVPPTPSGPLASAPGGSDCRLCDESGWIPCRRCSEKGQYAVTCEVCTGKRGLDCMLCDAQGHFRCPRCKGSREIRWQDGSRDRCKLCSGGKIVCPLCKGRDTLACPGCERRGKIEQTCEACFGLRGFPCPRCAPKGTCKACKGKRSMPCTVCFGEGGFPERCEKCYGLGIWLCDECIGGRAICRTCGATGKIRYVSSSTGTKAGTKTCDTCKGRGTYKCSNCAGKGRSSCPPTAGHEPCPHCKGASGTVRCGACKR